MSPPRRSPRRVGLRPARSAPAISHPRTSGSAMTAMRLPAEWEPHERTLMGWPCRRELWRDTLEQARADYAAVANAIGAFEPVTMIANPGADSAAARSACCDAVHVVEPGLDDPWLRD